MQPAIDIQQLTVAYDRNPVLESVSLQVPQGVCMALTGPNGAGKSTLLKAVTGLVKPQTGQVQVLGASYRQMRQQVAYVPQRATVDWHFPATVLEVALMGTYGRLGWLRRPDRQARADAWQALEQVGMHEMAALPLAELSGGQQQRTFLARALAQQAQLFLLDEPFQGIDAPTERAIAALLQELRVAGKSIIAVHHDLHTVPSYFDWVALLNRKVVALGPVATAFSPETIAQTYQ